MAQKRMFSKTIARTDNFIEMPPTAQNLYFHLGLEADDDGFVNPRMIMKTIGSPDDDLKILMVKGYVIPFRSGIIVITHWKENNYIAKDRYKETRYKKELRRLKCENNVYILYTKVRLDSGKGRILTAKQVGGKEGENDIERLTDYFIKIKGTSERRARYFRAAGELLILSDNNLEKAKKRVDITKKWADDESINWELDTVIKKYMQLENKVI